MDRIETYFNIAGSLPVVAIASGALRAVIGKVQFVAGAVLAVIGAIGFKVTGNNRWASITFEGVKHLKQGTLNVCRGVAETLLGLTPAFLIFQLKRKEGFAPIHKYQIRGPQAPVKIDHQQVASQQLSSKTAEELDSDWQIKDYFGHIKVLGTKGSERDKIQVAEFKKVGLKEGDFEYSAPVNGETLPEKIWKRVPSCHAKSDKARQGIAGCTMAHYQLIKDSRDRYRQALAELKKAKEAEALAKAEADVKKYSSVLIMEDNCAFGHLSRQQADLKGVGRDFRENMKHLPKDWDMFYGMTMHGQWSPEIKMPHNPWLYRSSYGVVMKCFAVNCTAYDKVVKAFENRLFGKGRIPPCDHITAALHHRLNVYMAKRSFAYRYASKSQVGGGGDTSDHWQPNPIPFSLRRILFNK